jgi:hypothetical protein
MSKLPKVKRIDPVPGPSLLEPSPIMGQEPEEGVRHQLEGHSRTLLALATVTWNRGFSNHAAHGKPLLMSKPLLMGKPHAFEVHERSAAQEVRVAGY